MTCRWEEWDGALYYATARSRTNGPAGFEDQQWTRTLSSVEAAYQPAGDQPQAIDKLVGGLSDGLAHQTLLGVTGSGKTFSIANVIQRVQRPTMVLAHNKTLAAPALRRVPRVLPAQRGGIFRFVLRLPSRRRTCLRRTRT